MLMPSIYGENLFDDFFDGFPFFNNKELRKMENKLYGSHAGRMMTTDIKEKENGYELEMELPGFAKEDIKVALENGYLSIQAAKNMEQSEQDKETGRYIRRERYAGTCNRSFYVGDEMTEEDIKAEFRDGVLKLFLPKKDEKPAVEQKKYIAIEG